MLPTFIKFASSTTGRRRFITEDEPPPITTSTINKAQQSQQPAAAAGAPTTTSTMPTSEPGSPVATETKTVVSTGVLTDAESASIVSSISDHDLLASLHSATHPSSPPSPLASPPAAVTAAVAASGGKGDPSSTFTVEPWDKTTLYSTYIRDALRYLQRRDDGVIMLFESPSTADKESSFYNCQVYKFHDYPPASNPYKTVLGPCRYSLMNGNDYPSYLERGAPPAGLLEHWEECVPGFVQPSFVSHLPTLGDPGIVDEESAPPIYAYLPCESLANHVNDPHVHYHLAGKDALHLMTSKTPKLLNNTKVHRPCIAKVTHSMGSKGIFVIRNEDDEAEFEAFLEESGNPNFVVTEFVDIARNVACHFFIHPNGKVTWFGSNENYKEADGHWSMDSYLLLRDQERLKEMQVPYVKDIVQYCLSLGFFGFCGIDVLFDHDGKGYVVDVNPRVTGSCPSLMVAQLLQDECGYECGLFRRNGNITYPGSAAELLADVQAHNAAHVGTSRVVLFGFHEEHPRKTKLNVAVYGHSVDECRTVLNHFAQHAEE